MRTKLIILAVAMVLFVCFVGVGNLYCQTAGEHFDRGNAYKANGEYYRAAEEFKQSIALDTSEFKAYTNLGLTYNKMGRYNDAIRNFERAVGIYSGDHMAYSGMGVSYHYLENYAKSAECYEKAIRAKPDYALAYDNLGLAYVNLGDYENSMKNFNKAIELYRSQGNYRKANEIEGFIEEINTALGL